MHEKFTWKSNLKLKTYFFYSFSFFLIVLNLGISHATAETTSPVIIDLDNGWKEVHPGGDTVCARGSEFTFYVYPGKSNKLVIDFMGGGACWDETSCAKDSATFYDSVDELRKWAKKGFNGFYNHKDERNPVADWTHIIVPYCTGDIHWGDAVRQYGTGDKAFTIYHKGAVNAKAALSFAFENYKTPEQVFITGCSAGSYGSIYWTPYIRENYRDSRVQQFGDSGAGIITSEFSHNYFPLWNPTAHAPYWIPSVDPRNVDWYGLPSSKLYTEIGKFYPDVQLSQYNSAFDSNQIFYYEMMGGNNDEAVWSKKMTDNMKIITSELPNNYTYYVAGGQDHCILPYDYFYSVETQGVPFVNWLDQYLKNNTVPSVTCKDRECDPINF